MNIGQEKFTTCRSTTESRRHRPFEQAPSATEISYRLAELGEDIDTYYFLLSSLVLSSIRINTSPQSGPVYIQNKTELIFPLPFLHLDRDVVARWFRFEFVLAVFSFSFSFQYQVGGDQVLKTPFYSIGGFWGLRETTGRPAARW